MANAYDIAALEVGTEWDWDDVGTAFSVIMVTSAYVFDAAHTTLADVTGEITNPGYAAGGLPLVGRSASQVVGGAQYDAGDLTFPALGAGDQPAATIVFRDTGVASTSSLVCYGPYTGAPVPNGQGWRNEWAATGVFQVLT